MQATYINEIAQHEGKAVELRGWLYRKREGGKIIFLMVRDGTGIIQGVLSREREAAFETAKKLTQESSLIVQGTVKAEPRSPGGFELHVTDVQPVHIAQDYPITPKAHGAEFLLNHRHLWIRSAKQVPLLRVRHEVMQAIRDFFHTRGFIATESPLLTPISVEGTTTLFATPYFDLGNAYLSQSGQLYLEATAMALGRVYWIGPAFRAEKSKTRKHLTEFWMAEGEMAYCDHDANLKLQEDLVKYVIQRVLDHKGAELQALGRDRAPLERIVSQPFARITYDEAIALVNRPESLAFMARKWAQRRGVEEEDQTSEGEAKAVQELPTLSQAEIDKLVSEHTLRMEIGDDFGAPQEEAISHHFGSPVFIEKYPSSMKPFYMEPDPSNPDRVLNADLIAPEGYGEIIGGSCRAFELELLERKLLENNLPKEPYEWFLDLRRYGSVPHAGFGLGVERTVAWVAGV
ncbi:MAG TPA: amino acid--tRNA ligase-related protein, partial [Candidatus Bipolaricaulota bacterium]